MTTNNVVDRDQWETARADLLVREKEHTRRADELAQERRNLPWVRIEKDYRFDTERGVQTLAELFDGRSQLLVHHFMFGPDYDAGCPTCSSSADVVNGILPHLRARDVTMLYISRAPLAKLLAYRSRMGWQIPWVSSYDSDFNLDFGVSFPTQEVREKLDADDDGPAPVLQQLAETTGTDEAGYLSESVGVSAFVLDDGVVYQTYSTRDRGTEFMMGYYPFLDRVAKGRDEDDGTFWLRRHDEYHADR